MNIKEYWDIRYMQGGDSGSGSRGDLLSWKAEVINQFIKQKKIKSVMDFGCGKGDLASLINVDAYYGYDISPQAVKLCPKTLGKSFDVLPEYLNQSDLAMSIDVIFHCVDVESYDKHLFNLFQAGKKFVIIYGFDHEVDGTIHYANHYFPRKFTKDIEIMYPKLKLIKTIKNKYPAEKYGPENGSLSNFYIYQKNG